MLSVSEPWALETDYKMFVFSPSVKAQELSNSENCDWLWISCLLLAEYGGHM